MTFLEKALLLVMMSGAGAAIIALIYLFIFLVTSLFVWIGSFTALYTFSWFLSFQVFIVFMLLRVAIRFLFGKKDINVINRK